MQLVEQHVIKRSDPRFVSIDAAAFQAKNLYNAALYLVRQSFIFEGRYLGYKAVYHQMKTQEAYRALPTKVAQQVLRLLDKNWQSYFAACLASQEDPAKLHKHPKMPHYKHKTDGRYALVYTIQALSRPGLKQGIIAPSQLPITVQTKQARIAQVRIVPRIGYYVVEVVYEHAEVAPSGHPSLSAAVDIGVDNLAAITSNKKGFVPRLVNGRPIKSTNRYYNKRRAEWQEAAGTPGITAREESYTSQASFLDGDAIPTYDPKQEGKHTFSGRRIQRGLYRAKDGRCLNADVNGSYNILRKALPDALSKGIEGIVVYPVWLTFAWSVQPCALAAA